MSEQSFEENFYAIMRQPSLQQDILDALPEHEFPSQMVLDAVDNPLDDPTHVQGCLEEAGEYIEDQWQLPFGLGLSYAAYYASIMRRESSEDGQG